MDAEPKIRVRKRDGMVEPFDERRLAALLARVLAQTGGTRQDAVELARAIRIYLQRQNRLIVQSTALFEMAVKALRRIAQPDAAELLELHRTLRSVRRRLLRVLHEDGRVTDWDKCWLADLAERSWHLSRRTARILAGEVEVSMLGQEEKILSRQVLIERLNAHVDRAGLADAVPVEHHAVM